jgi:hypothetical protein
VRQSGDDSAVRGVFIAVWPDGLRKLQDGVRPASPSAGRLLGRLRNRYGARKVAVCK